MALDPGHGYWSVAIGPLPINANRFPPNRLLGRVDDSVVALRGWNYPHVDNKEPGMITQGSQYVQCRTAWGQYQEVFRFHTNGLFTHRWRMREDGTSYKGTFHFVAAIYSVAEVWEFAKRLYGQDDAVERVRVQILLENVYGRRGSGDSFEDLPYVTTARQNTFEWRVDIQRIDLAAGVRRHAVETTLALFKYLGFVDIGEAFVSRKTESFLTGRL